MPPGLAPAASRPGLRIALALAAVIALALPRGASAAPAPASDRQVAAFLMVSPGATFEFFGMDGHGPDSDGWVNELGGGVSVAWRLARWFEIGLVLRYDTGAGEGDRTHFLAAPFTATAVLPLGTKREVRLGVGFGPELGVTPGDSLLMLGGSAEVGIGYSELLDAERGLRGFMQVGMRVDYLPELNGHPNYLDDGVMLNVQLVFARVGVGWR